MPKYILNFGDSWAHAADAGCSNGYANLVARDLGYQYLDYSMPSTSIPRMILQLRQFLDNDYDPANEYVALFFVTAAERLTLFDDAGQLYDIWPQSFEDFYSRWYASEFGEFVANTSLITLQSICRCYSLNDVYMLGWQNIKLWPEVDRSKFLDQAKTSIANRFGGQTDKPLFDLINKKNSQYLIENNWHPNAKGHRFIADLVIEHLTPDH